MLQDSRWYGRSHLSTFDHFYWLPYALSNTFRRYPAVIGDSKWWMVLGKTTYPRSLSACEVIRLTWINHTHSPIFSIALSQFRSKVKRKDDCILDVTSAQELLRQTKAIIEQQASTRTKRSTPSNRLETIFPRLNDFTVVIAACDWANPTTMGLIWGSLRLSGRWNQCC